MVDPISVGASSLAKAASNAVTKQLQSKAGVRLGSRDERRQVYARFQAAVTEAYTTMAATRLEAQLYAMRVGPRRWTVTFRPGLATRATRQALHALRAQQSEVLQAYMDVRLVANPAPLEAADLVLDQLNAVFDLDLTVSNDDMTNAVSRVVEAQRAFIDVARDDLLYLPKRWQFYRAGWWTARRWRKRQPRR
ncbi:hypothetical protein [Streptomyces sp. NPDC001914]|uniref:hypothetical protein n=1 Tax=Streptomyces sp. NPDC001914 TaxID=3364623 RepID=UPI00368473B9